MIAWLKKQPRPVWVRWLVACWVGILSLAWVLPWTPPELSTSQQVQPEAALAAHERPRFNKPTMAEQMEWAWQHDVEWAEVAPAASKRGKSNPSALDMTMQWAWRGTLPNLESAWSEMEPAVQWDGVVNHLSLQRNPQTTKDWTLAVNLQPFAGQSWPMHSLWPEAAWLSAADTDQTTDEKTTASVGLAEVNRWRYLGWAGTTATQGRVWLQTPMGIRGWEMGQVIDGSDWMVARRTPDSVWLVNSDAQEVHLKAHQQESKRK